ncbi:MAG: hypothetical protein WCX71_04970 [Candidatus Buchananbacteria bacterium]
MRTIRLRGLAEGLAGKSTVQAMSAEHVFGQIPALQSVRHKLTINGDTISGFAACDG